MTDCLLHIGVEKTGSTSIQMTLARNRDKLTALGLLYPEALGEKNQVKAYAYASSGPVDELKSPLGLNNPGAVQPFREQVKTQLAREIALKKPKRIIISNEHCSSRLLERSEIERLAKLLRPHCISIKVVVYIRRQGEALRSAYSTYVKTGGTEEFTLPDRTDVERKYNYEAILDRWGAVFGVENMDVRIFSRDRLVGGDVVSDFLTKLGLAPSHFTIVREQNKSLGRVGTEFLKQFNKVVPYTIGADFNPARGNIQGIVETFQEEWPYVGDPTVIARLDDEMATPNNRVRERYLVEKTGPLFPPSSVPEAPITRPMVTPDEIMRVMAFVWEAKQNQVLRLKKRLDDAASPAAPKAGTTAVRTGMGVGGMATTPGRPRPGLNPSSPTAGPTKVAPRPQPANGPGAPARPTPADRLPPLRGG